jgi:hypothetical protein
MWSLANLCGAIFYHSEEESTHDMPYIPLKIRVKLRGDRSNK